MFFSHTEFRDELADEIKRLHGAGAHIDATRERTIIYLGGYYTVVTLKVEDGTLKITQEVEHALRHADISSRQGFMRKTGILVDQAIANIAKTTLRILENIQKQK